MNLSPVTQGHRWLQQDLGTYNAHDCYATAAAEPALRRLLAESGNAGYFEHWFARFVPVVMAMQRRGFGRLDRPARIAKYRDLAREMRGVERDFLGGVSRFHAARDAAHGGYLAAVSGARDAHAARLQTVDQWVAEAPARRTPDARARKSAEKLEGELRRAASALERTHVLLKKRTHSVFNKSNDLREILFDDWGVRPAPPIRAHNGVDWKRPPRSTGQEAVLFVLDHLRRGDEPHREAIEGLAHRFRLGKMRSYLTDLWTGPDDRLYPTIQCASARTMRLAYGDPALQQWPQELRDLVRAAPGCVFIGADKRQIEARIFALETDDTGDLELFRRYDAATSDAERDRYDVHGQAARDRAAFTWDVWCEMPPGLRKLHRNDAKRFRYRLQYGGDDETEKAQTFCPCRRCVDKVPQLLKLAPAVRIAAQQRWLTAHPTVSRWQDALCETVRRGGNRYTSRFGYTRRYSEPWPSVRTKVVNFPCQHGAAEIVNRAMMRLHWEYNAPMVLQHHDSIVLEVPRHTATWWSQVIKHVMEKPVPEYGGYSFPVDVKVGETWGQI